MKRIQDIEKLTAADWDRIGADESIPVPSDWKVQLPEHHRHTAAVWSIAASVAVVAGIGLTALLRTPEPEDTFTDPYLAYAAIEQAFGRMGNAVSQGAVILEQKESEFDKVTYWK
jgi:hypothetical protein